MTKAYTKKGDKGYTKSISGKYVSKDDFSIVVLSKIDMLQSVIDMAVLSESGRTKKFLEEIQRNLWQISTEISGSGKSFEVEPITEGEMKRLEKFIDSLGHPPKGFIRFKTRAAIVLNECRVRCRELELLLVKLLRQKKISRLSFAYVNRLSSLFFMLAYKKMTTKCPFLGVLGYKEYSK